MTRTKILFRFFAVACLTLTFAALAAAAPQVYVSAKGNDANACDRAAPCATFAGAINQLDAGGEVTVLDSGSYGAVVITKSMQIVAPAGVQATILKSSTDNGGVLINAAATDTVVLRGLTIKGSSLSNIEFVSGGALHVEDCVIADAAYRGIRVVAPGKIYVKNTVVRNNYLGIEFSSSSGTIQATIENTTVKNNAGIGVYISANARVAVTDSVSTGNSDGFYTVSNGKLTAQRTTAANNNRYGFATLGGASAASALDECAATGNGDAGIYNGGGGLPTGIYTRVSNTVSTNNKYGFYNLGFFESYGNNRVRGNTTNTSGTITVVSQN